MGMQNLVSTRNMMELHLICSYGREGLNDLGECKSDLEWVPFFPLNDC